MTISRINSNPRLSDAVVFGQLVFLSGQVPSDRTQDARGQTREVLEKIDRLLATVGSDRAHILSATLWLKDIARDFAAMNEEWVAWLPQGASPARATSEANLASPDVLVEIMLTAAVISPQDQ
ncbi:RidA family protein [Vogesella alkaliphila]|uniref:RidA family protein n=1 Tax=Vogesella alkaliphila TaxID=1193621 RepID=A0ABQ2Z2G8_9NEIS|nr:RidA family protein [Vogesella alkaliphila]GGY01213.1 hypothetical protein GCM10011290_31520 [Vogesella alkaliphila]